MLREHHRIDELSASRRRSGRSPADPSSSRAPRTARRCTSPPRRCRRCGRSPWPSTRRESREKGASTSCRSSSVLYSQFGAREDPAARDARHSLVVEQGDLLLPGAHDGTRCPVACRGRCRRVGAVDVGSLLRLGRARAASRRRAAADQRGRRDERPGTGRLRHRRPARARARTLQAPPNRRRAWYVLCGEHPQSPAPAAEPRESPGCGRGGRAAQPPPAVHARDHRRGAGGRGCHRARRAAHSDNSAASTTTTTTTVSTSTTAPALHHRRVPSAAGKPCVAMKGALPAGAPAVPVKVGPPPTKLVKQDLKVGTGAVVKPGATVTVDYIGVACSTGQDLRLVVLAQPAVHHPARRRRAGLEAGHPGHARGRRTPARHPARAWPTARRAPAPASRPTRHSGSSWTS